MLHCSAADCWTTPEQISIHLPFTLMKTRCHVECTEAESLHLHCRPQELGQAPETRFRHAAVVAALPCASVLHDALAAQLSDLGVAEAPESGTLILLWAGYNTMGVEFGGSDIQVTL